MEFILNELSLNGQYSSLDDFVDNGLRPVLEVLKILNCYKIPAVLKKSDFYASKAFEQVTFYDTLFARNTIRHPAITRFKSLLTNLTKNPFWDNTPQQLYQSKYFIIEDIHNKDVSGSGIAEAYARNGGLISFSQGGYDRTPIIVKKDDDEVIKDIHNFYDNYEIEKTLFNLKLIAIDNYIKQRFNKKMNFDELDNNNGFNLIKSLNISVFLDSFHKFERLTWNQIQRDNGLDFKKFNCNKRTKRFFNNTYWSKGIYKFRINQEIRCFGYIQNEIFHVLRIDLDHILSDLG